MIHVQRLKLVGFLLIASQSVTGSTEKATGCSSRFDNFRRHCIGELEIHGYSSN